MDEKSISQRIGWLLILGGFIFVIGGILYTGRVIWKWPVAAKPAFLRWERGFVIAALLTVVVGLILLSRRLETSGDKVLAPSGAAIFLIGAVVITVAETFFLSRQEWITAAVVVFVVLAFLAQALFGAALLNTGLLPEWVGWATIIWNLGCLIVLPIARPRDIYYPWLHYVAPMLIGFTLLLKG